MLRPEGPPLNSRDRQVVVRVLEISEEAGRTGMECHACRPFGPRVLPGLLTPTSRSGLLHLGASRLPYRVAMAPAADLHCPSLRATCSATSLET